jgi:hypothetical protein
MDGCQNYQNTIFFFLQKKKKKNAKIQGVGQNLTEFTKISTLESLLIFILFLIIKKYKYFLKILTAFNGKS